MEYFHGILCMYDAFYSYDILEYKLSRPIILKSIKRPNDLRRYFGPILRQPIKISKLKQF